MSWDLFAFKARPLPPGVKPKQEDHLPLGTVEEVRRAVEKGNIETDWSGSFWCYHDGDGFRIDFNIGSWNSEDDDILYHVGIEVRGGGNPLPTLKQVAEEHGWLLEDLATGQILDPAKLSAAGLETAREAEEAAKARVVEQYGQK